MNNKNKYAAIYTEGTITFEAKSLLGAKRIATKYWGGYDHKCLLVNEHGVPLARRTRWDGFNAWGLNPWEEVQS